MGPSVIDVIRAMFSPSMAKEVGFQPLAASGITLEASEIMTWKTMNYFSQKCSAFVDNLDE